MSPLRFILAGSSPSDIWVGCPRGNGACARGQPLPAAMGKSQEKGWGRETAIGGNCVRPGAKREDDAEVAVERGATVRGRRVVVVVVIVVVGLLFFV